MGWELAIRKGGNKFGPHSGGFKMFWTSWGGGDQNIFTYLIKLYASHGVSLKIFAVIFLPQNQEQQGCLALTLLCPAIWC